jgi:hypothetical protein
VIECIYIYTLGEGRKILQSTENRCDDDSLWSFISRDYT